ncbi:MAG TPA: beta-1,6-N-acetylglucosaminyltransferase [Burkholderiaceae bacterium]|nr:beta-1,6-N-acetylglucosaminyltransferase [Burkholderiaceae bacterium]
MARTLAPHLVVVHHDFQKKADFEVSGSNVRLIPDPRDTGWGAWGFSQAIFHTLDYCLDNFEFDYFHLMSPTCLPIRPLAEFEARVRSAEHDVHADLFPVERDDDTLMTFGYRTYLPGSSLRYRTLMRARQWYFGSEAPLLQTSSLSVLALPEARRNRPPLRMRAGLGLTRLASRGWLGPNPFGPDFRPMIGSTWIGMTREVVQYVSNKQRDPRVRRFFRHLKIVDESLFPTLLGNSPFRIGHANHAINDFTAAGNPRWIDDQDYERLAASGRYFARKFPDDPTAAVRLRAIRRIGIDLREPQAA